MAKKIKSQITEYFDEFENYGSYYQGPWKYCRYEMNRIVKKRFGRQKIKILDLGCGRFSSLPYLLTDKHTESYHCVDSSSKSVKALKRLSPNNKKIIISQSDIMDFIKSSREKFDVIVLFGTVMYLDGAKARELFLTLDNLLKSGGIALLYEPNEKAKGGLDQYGHVMDLNWLNDILNKNKKMKIKQIYFLNILGLRRILYAVFSKLNKIKRIGGILNPIEDFSWRLEFGIENLLSKFKLGCDDLIIIEKNNNYVC